MPSKAAIISLATAWGPRHGGVNAFNIELVKSLGILPCRNYDLFCVVLNASDEEREDASNCGVELISLGIDGKAFPDDTASGLIERLADHTPGEGWIWLGHDTVSGGLSLQLRDGFPGSKTVLIHHMAFGAYQDYKKGSSLEAIDKRELQRAMFAQADLCLAVGPMLCGQLEDLLGPHSRPVEMIVPGLPEPPDISDTPPDNFTAFVAGRLGNEDDRIKQGGLAVRAYGATLAKAFGKEKFKNSRLRRSPTLRMRGVPGEAQAPVRTLLGQASGRVVNCDLAPFGEDRAAYFRDLAGSSVALMPSWHEGFGLVAWEAIACAVPVVIGEQSGVYRLLRDRQVSLDQSVRSVAVQGHLPESDEEPNHSDADVQAVRDALFDIGDHILDRKQDAVSLATILRHDHDYTWPRCARDLLSALNGHLDLVLCDADTRAEPVPPRPEPPEPPADLPAFLHPPRPRPWRPELGQAPSALLVARDQIVPFDPERDAVVEAWLDWAAAPATPRIALRLVTGPGGMGKTRSAIECLRRARARGWQPLWLGGDLPEDWQAQWRAWLGRPHASDTPVLLAIDYAEGRQEAILRLLDTTLALAADIDRLPPLRLILLARATAWWPELPHYGSPEVAALLTGPANAGMEAIPPWNTATEARERTYLAALRAYAAARGLPGPERPYQPDFTAPMYARPLHLHMAALVTLAGERPEHATALLNSQLGREWRYWSQSRLAPEAGYDDWADTLAWLALVQGATVAQTHAATSGLGLAAPDLVAGLARAYPAEAEAIGPLQPDPLAEALILERLAGRRGQALVENALAEDPALASRTLEVIGRVAARAEAGWPPESEPLWHRHLGQGLDPAWPRHAQQLVAAAHSGSPALGRLVLSSWRRLSPEMQAGIAPRLRLPDYSTPLLNLSVEVERVRLEATDKPEKRAGILNNLANRLSNLGDADSRAEALTCAREAAAVYRDLAQAQPAAYRPDLAMSLNNLANNLSEQGDADSRAEALTCAREAAAVYRDLAQAQPAAYRPDLAMSLNTLAARLSEQGDADSRAEALTCAREAVAIRRELAQAQPAAYRPDLAMSLNNLANNLSEQGDADSRAEALTCAREAAAVYRELAQAQPAAYRPDLAMSLNNLAAHLSEQGDADSRAEALACAREAVAIRRELAQAQPAAYRPDLAMSLNNLANNLSEQGDADSRAEALACAREAAAVYRELAQAQPAAYRPDLAMSLNNLAAHLSEQGDADSRAEALACAREAVAIRRELAQAQPAAYRPNLAMSLNNLANNLSEQGDADSRAEALTCAREAVAIRRELAQAQPAAYRPDLAASLNNLANNLSEQGDADSRAEALTCAREAAAVYRELAQAQPAAYRPDLAMSLNNLANNLSEQGDADSRAEALTCAREAAAVYRELAQAQPAAYRPDLAMSLNNLANNLSEQGDADSRAEALTCAREAAAVYRELAQAQPAAYRPDLAMSLNNLAAHLSEQGDADSRAEALACAREAVAIRRELAQAQPAAYRPDLAMSLNNLANNLSEQGDADSRAEALACAREAAAVYRELAQAQPAAYRPDLAMSLNNLAAHLSEQGDADSRAEALACAREAVAIRRELAQAQPAAYRPNLAMSLNNLAAHLSEQGDADSRAEALTCAREAAAVYRELAQAQPAAYRPNLAASLNNLAAHLSEQGDADSRAEALACAREAVAIRRELAQAQPAAYRPSLAASLNNLAAHLSEQGDADSRAEALTCAREAVAIYAWCHGQMPAAFERNLGIAIGTLGRAARALGRDPEKELRELFGQEGDDEG
ncbi:tetratricopeptide repeat protein [Parasulfuritortus cantonensis]|uniref:Tetratricopeptide repeat protein n=1 Tax=Parasulfuritortus cantonensis TaxID=2528202 RepID=A0A4R1BA85_9PROT|nr:tetratricopeptide repeat protein [Parasulfuritortus cantonensis]TCJ13853.1 tetratricopeptide repeat protein [Parasulfuritortus cantonensis]